MKMLKKYLLLFVLSLPFGSAPASENREHRVPSVGTESSRPYAAVSCTNKNVNFLIQWNTKIGTSGKYRRHLVLPGDLGDTHILLRVMPGETSTGIVENDLQAKSLIKLILQNIKTDYMLLEVFPEGRDTATGEWESIEFRTSEVLTAITMAAKECNWDITKSTGIVARTVVPGVPYDGE